MNWKRVRKNQLENLKDALDYPKALWGEYGWLTPFAMIVGLAILTVICAVGGFLIAWLLDGLGIVDLVKYDKSVDPDATAQGLDWLR